MIDRISTHARGKRVAARLSLGAALAAGLAFGAVAVPSAASAKDKPEAAASGKPANSKAFAEAYKPVADIANSATGDYAAAKAQLPAVTAAIANDTDKFTAGNLELVLGNKLKDQALQRQGLEMMLQSGQADPAKVGQIQFFIGNLAFDAKDYAAARTALQAAVAAGYTENDPRPLIAESYFASGQQAQGLTYLSDMIQKSTTKVPEKWLLRGLQVAYDAKLAPQAAQYSRLLVENYPTQSNWTKALQVVYALNSLDDQAQLDLLRLMRATGSLDQKREYANYVAAADPRKMSNEVLAVLDEGAKSGVFPASDPTASQARSLATPRAASDRSGAAAVAADARKSADGAVAMGAGDQYFSFGAYDQAAEMYKLALDKGVKDRETVLTRLGIAQALQGKYADAKASLQQVTGARAPVATMWIAYADSKAAPTA